MSDNEGNSAEGEFMVAALYGYMAIVQSGNGLEVLDGGSAAILPMQPGSSVPLIYRELLPDGSLLYERMGGSSVDLFRYDHNEIVQIGESNGLNTVYDNHTPDGKIFFEQGTSSETGVGETTCDSDHPNPTSSQSHPAVTPSTDLFPSQPPGHLSRNPRPRQTAPPQQ